MMRAFFGRSAAAGKGRQPVCLSLAGAARDKHPAVGGARVTNEELAALAKAGDAAAAVQLWQQNRPLLHMLFARLANNPVNTRRMQAAGVTLADLEQGGYFVVLNACKKYRPEAGAKFSSFLQYPAATAFYNEIGLRTARQKAEALNIAARLEESISNNADALTLQDVLQDDAAEEELRTVERRLYRQQLHSALERCLQHLPEKQAVVLRARYYDGGTLAETAQVLGVSLQNVARLETLALRAMRRQRAQLQGFLYDVCS